MAAEREEAGMKFLTGEMETTTKEIAEILAGGLDGEEVKVNGCIHKIRKMGEVAFIILRKREGLVQAVYEEGAANVTLKELAEEAAVEITGIVKSEERAPNGFEIRIHKIRILSRPSAPMPIAVNKWKMNTSLDTPKIGARGAEGGANLFRLEYFHRHAVLAQSPQFYKQMMVGVFDRVFEVAPVFRAEKHNTKRHLNEYTSLDFEMGYIESFEDIMQMETGFLQYTMALLEREYQQELKLLDVSLPKTDKIPQVRFDRAKQLAAEKYHREIRNPYDLEPEEEVLISRYFKEEMDADFVFVTHYPSKKRPFYAMDAPDDEKFTLSFDLLFQGLEITTGGQRIHDYAMLEEKLQQRGMTQEGMEQYMLVFKHGMPPHGGLGIGLERLTMKLLGEDNVRETTLFPRDLARLEP